MTAAEEHRKEADRLAMLKDQRQQDDVPALPYALMEQCYRRLAEKRAAA